MSNCVATTSVEEAIPPPNCMFIQLVGTSVPGDGSRVLSTWRCFRPTLPRSFIVFFKSYPTQLDDHSLSLYYTLAKLFTRTQAHEWEQFIVLKLGRLTEWIACLHTI